MVDEKILEFTCLGSRGIRLRIQILPVPSGYVISHAIEAKEKLPISLRSYGGGWKLYPSRIITTQKKAIAILKKHGWR